MYMFRVRELREKLGLTQHDLCMKYDIQFTTLRNIEKNRVSNIKTETLFKLKKAFGLSCLDDLFEFKEDE